MSQYCGRYCTKLHQCKHGLTVLHYQQFCAMNMFTLATLGNMTQIEMILLNHLHWQHLLA